MPDSPDRSVLPADDVRRWAADHHPWSVGTGGDRLLRTFEFSDFAGAMRFMAAVEPTADRLDHHPDWRNVYNKVWVELTTHDSDGVTALDLELGDAMDSAARKLGAT